MILQVIWTILLLWIGSANFCCMYLWIVGSLAYGWAMCLTVGKLLACVSYFSSMWLLRFQQANLTSLTR